MDTNSKLGALAANARSEKLRQPCLPLSGEAGEEWSADVEACASAKADGSGAHLWLFAAITLPCHAQMRDKKLAVILVKAARERLRKVSGGGGGWGKGGVGSTERGE